MVAAPLFQPRPEGPAPLPPAEREALERRKRQALAAIREAELDHRMGKLSDEDLQHDARTLRDTGARGDGGAREGGAVITIEQFRGLELRVGTVKQAEPHPNADRLLVLRVDLGTEERQVVAGIRAPLRPGGARRAAGRRAWRISSPRSSAASRARGWCWRRLDGERVVLVRPDDAVAAGAVVR